MGDTLTMENYIVINPKDLQLEKYSNDELNEMQWGGTIENELVSIRHGDSKIFRDGKIENITKYERGK